ncbi:phosphatidylinositol-3,5-bisphosphate 3-phosphatase MTMR14-like [Glandiceps talaboti]
MSGSQVASAVADSLVDEGHVKDLIESFAKVRYRACERDSKFEIVERRCLHLFAKDYKYSVIHNSSGELCNHYPSKLILLEYALPVGHPPDHVESLYDLPKIQDLITKSRFARCRSRFVMPVILYEGKHICRSSTLSSGAEIYGRSGYDYFFTGGNGVPQDEVPDSDNDSLPNPSSGSDWQLFDRIRGQDIKLLKTLSVSYICDLMMEQKKVKFGMNVTSSEKADKEHRYSDFSLLSLPYPGCEFFRDYKDNSYIGEGLVFDWGQGFVDANLLIPQRCQMEKLGIDWTKYRSWDLVTITQNYLKLLLHLLRDEEKSGLLVHCISGWDRTPLFVSILRLSLWADGKIHQSLSAIEILYLTIAYDWLLFGHHLSDRLVKGEEIFFFCFNFLKDIVSDEYSVNHQNHRTINRYDSDGQFDQMVLLDSEDINRQRCGSTTSLNSASSITSVSSNSSPIVFNVLEKPDEDDQQNENSFVSSSTSTSSVIYKPFNNNSNANATGVNSPGDRLGTSPMAVPKTHRKCSTDATNCKSAASSDCGSWQMISKNGSCKDFTSSSCSCTTDSGSSNGSSGGSSSVANHSSSAPEESSRHEKLSSVRTAFITMYGEVVGLKNGYGSEAGVLGYLVDNLKGIKSRLF